MRNEKVLCMIHTLKKKRMNWIILPLSNDNDRMVNRWKDKETKIKDVVCEARNGENGIHT